MRKHPLVVAVSSAAPSEGKTTVATNLAAAMGESGRRVLLVDADLRRPLVAQYTHLSGAVGLAEVLVGTVSLTDAVQTLGSSGVDVLAGGGLPPNPGELVASSHMADVLTEARVRYDVVVVDTAPILAVADALSLTQLADGLVLVARAGVTSKADLARSLETIRNGGGNVFGVVINDVRSRSAHLRDYQYSQEPAPSLAPADSSG